MPGTDDRMSKYNTAQAFLARAATHRALGFLCEHRAAAGKFVMDELTADWDGLYDEVDVLAHDRVNDDGELSLETGDVTAESMVACWTIQIETLVAYKRRWDDTEVEDHRYRFNQAVELLARAYTELNIARNCLTAAFASASAEEQPGDEDRAGEEEEGDGTDTDDASPADDPGAGEGATEEEHDEEVPAKPEPGDPANPGDIVDRPEEEVARE